MNRPAGSNADEWQLFLQHWLEGDGLASHLADNIPFLAVQIAEAVDADRPCEAPCCCERVAQLQDAKRRALAVANRRSYESVAMRAALGPLAAIPLWRDTYPDANIDRTLQAIECITVEDVRAARAALADEQGRDMNHPHPKDEPIETWSPARLKFEVASISGTPEYLMMLEYEKVDRKLPVTTDEMRSYIRAHKR